MRKIIILSFAVILSFAADAQTTLSGKITDLNTGEALIGRLAYCFSSIKNK